MGDGPAPAPGPSAGRDGVSGRCVDLGHALGRRLDRGDHLQRTARSLGAEDRTGFRPIRLRLSRLAKDRQGGTGATGAAACPAALWAVTSGTPLAVLWEGVCRAGALVFGGGHVVLPLLQTAVVQSGTVSTVDHLAGYGAAQAMPVPLFSFAAYLGAWSRGRWVSGQEALRCWWSFSCQPF
ncbi:chromate transporter [Stenotrophomonas indicatrix]|uniref:chromate transporter n=1 Tax=Stenotrophomonas indicatrix TaxID=2045451 RepID=UPI001FAF5DD3|nr:chromate transporter [Stenotrophomonas indicatrix]